MCLAEMGGLANLALLAALEDSATPWEPEDMADASRWIATRLRSLTHQATKRSRLTIDGGTLACCHAWAALVAPDHPGADHALTD